MYTSHEEFPLLLIEVTAAVVFPPLMLLVMVLQREERILWGAAKLVYTAVNVVFAVIGLPVPDQVPFHK
jgi:hypothetical protein